MATLASHYERSLKAVASFKQGHNVHKCVYVERISLTNKIPIGMTTIAVSTKAPTMIPEKDQT